MPNKQLASTGRKKNLIKILGLFFLIDIETNPIKTIEFKIHYMMVVHQCLLLDFLDLQLFLVALNLISLYSLTVRSGEC